MKNLILFIMGTLRRFINKFMPKPEQKVTTKTVKVDPVKQNYEPKDKVKTCRKSTNGRRVYYQKIYDNQGKLIRTIKHIQESKARIHAASVKAEKSLLVVRTGKCSESTSRKKFFKDYLKYGIVIYPSNSIPFRGSVKDTFKLLPKNQIIKPEKQAS